MKGPARITALAVALAAMALSMSGCKRLQARDQLNKGVEAYKAEHYEQAISHFQQAADLDPTLPTAKAYLATALSRTVANGGDTPENVKVAKQAIGIFQQAIDQNPSDINSIKQIASIYYAINKLDDAKIWQKKVLAVDPKDPEAAYTIGVIDWSLAHKNVLDLLGPKGVTDDGEGNPKAPKDVMGAIKAKNAALVEEGLQYLNQAVANRSNYEEAMSYLNLIYRRKADLDFGNEAARKADVASADDWRTKAMGARKAIEAAKEKKTGGGITMDANGQMK